MSGVQEQPQPVLAYPNTAAPTKPSHHSNGSFGAVFIVLAVIVVISALACFLGRLCNRRVQNHKPKPQSHGGVGQKGKEANFKIPNKEANFQIPNKERDIEFGFEMRNPMGKMASGNGGSKGKGKSVIKPFDNSSTEIKHSDEGDFRASG